MDQDRTVEDPLLHLRHPPLLGDLREVLLVRLAAARVDLVAEEAHLAQAVQAAPAVPAVLAVLAALAALAALVAPVALPVLPAIAEGQAAADQALEPLMAVEGMLQVQVQVHIHIQIQIQIQIQIHVHPTLFTTRTILRIPTVVITIIPVGLGIVTESTYTFGAEENRQDIAIIRDKD